MRASRRSLAWQGKSSIFILKVSLLLGLWLIAAVLSYVGFVYVDESQMDQARPADVHTFDTACARHNIE